MINLRKKELYIMVGANYYKLSERPLLSGSTTMDWILWSEKRIRMDLTEDERRDIKKYDAFCFLPSHLEYEQSRGHYFNRYNKLSHEIVKGGFPKTLEFITHIFGEQVEIGLDYLTLLFRKPIQKLPILCLVSKERRTGKTTFLNWIKDIFQDNMTYCNNEDFRSNFNSTWVHKLIIGIDEVLFDKREDSEKLKNLATARNYKSEAKNQDRVQAEFFGKFILCSNNIYDFVKIDAGEDRFWVRRIKPLAKRNDNLRDDLEREIPHFLFYLRQRELSFQKESRLYFKSELLKTKALTRVISYTSSKYEKKFIECLIDIADSTEDEHLYYAPKDLEAMCKSHQIYLSRSDVIKFLKNKMNLTPTSNTSTYTKHILGRTGTVYSESSKGRYYSIPVNLIRHISDDFDD